MTRARASAVAVVALAACGGSRVKDLVPESTDVRVSAATAASSTEPAAPPADGYLHVAKRALGIVALADSRGVAEPAAREATDRLADALEACATDLGRSGRLVEGAARLAVQVGEDGVVGPVKLTASPGGAVTANALLCLVAPARMLTFPPGRADGGTRGLAVEATWGTVRER